jgi:hypothetical protein
LIDSVWRAGQEDEVTGADFELGPKDEVTLDMDPPTVQDETGNHPLLLPGIRELL